MLSRTTPPEPKGYLGKISSPDSSYKTYALHSEPQPNLIHILCEYFLTIFFIRAPEFIINTSEIKLPPAIKKYVDEIISAEVGLIGCRATDPKSSVSCCEYDLAILEQSVAGHQNKFLRIGEHNVELIHISGDLKKNTIATKGMSLVKDSIADYSIMVSPPTGQSNQSIDNENYGRALNSFGKKAIVRSLFSYDKVNGLMYKKPIIASMWSKLAAYDFLEGILALSGYRPMPLHELNQIRSLNIEDQNISAGINVAMACIGIERATRTTISRSCSAISQLYSQEYDKDLVIMKAKQLMKLGRLPDCYYYLGKMAHKVLTTKGPVFYNSYSKLIQVSLDLSLDSQQVEKLCLDLFNVAKNVLKNHRAVRRS